MISTVEYKHVSWQELTLTLFDHIPSDDDFTIIAARGFQFDIAPNPIYVRLAIIGASHFVSIWNDDIAFAEVFSCQRSFKNMPIQTFGWKNLNSENKLDWKIPGLAVNYSLHLEHHPQPMDIPSSFDNFMSKCEDKISIDFPTGNFDGTPFTTVGISLMKNELTIRSIHGYNQEKVTVFGQSKFLFT